MANLNRLKVVLAEQQKTGKTKNRFSCPECSKEIIRV